MKRMRNILILLLCAALLAGCGAKSAPAKALEGCRALLGVREGFLEDRAAELAGSSIGDWLAMALSACGANESYDAYLAALEQHVTERYAEQGTLDALMATEYSRTILTVSMLGGDPSAFGTRPDGTAIDLLNDGVWNFAGELGAQGLNGLIFALLAVDAGTYPEPERAKNTRAGIVEAIRAAQEPDGGFGLVSGASEADMTAMALQALAPYGRDETVERALAWLKDQMQPDGTFLAYGEPSAESCAQVLLALAALGIDPEQEFGSVNPETGLAEFRKADGSYAHLLTDTEGNLMATEQAMLALCALERLPDGGCVYESKYREAA